MKSSRLAFWFVFVMVLGGCQSSVPKETAAPPQTVKAPKPEAITLSIAVELKYERCLFTVWNGTDKTVILENNGMVQQCLLRKSDGDFLVTFNAESSDLTPVGLDRLLLVPANSSITYPVCIPPDNLREPLKSGMTFFGRIQPSSGDWENSLRPLALEHKELFLTKTIESAPVIAE